MLRRFRILVVWRLRADRNRTLCFGVLFALLALIQPIAYRHSYPTIADRRGFARAFGDDKALRLFAAVLGAPRWTRDLTPFAHLGLAPAQPFDATAATPVLLRRRDIAGN